MKRTAYLILFLLFVAACGREETGQVDILATYDSFGETISPDGAVPVQAVVAESETFVGTDMKLEGLIVEVCQNAGCWLSMTADDGSIVRVDVPRDDAGVYVYTFPTDIGGRRAIISGALSAGSIPHHAEGDEEHGDHGDADDQAAESAVMAATSLTLIADGALVERVRS